MTQKRSTSNGIFLFQLVRKLFTKGNQHSFVPNTSPHNSISSHAPCMTFGDFTIKCTEQCKCHDKTRTANIYLAALTSFITFNQKHDILLNDITQEIIGDYEAWLKKRKVSLNTISFYMRALRSVYNKAANAQLCIQKYPFKFVYTGIPKTVKRAISKVDIKRIRDLDLRHNPSLALSRDLFMFSFYTRGMAFIDIAYLSKRNIIGNTLIYRRRKTNQEMHILWEPCMQEIVERYSSDKSEYLLPIITKPENEYQQYLNAQHKINVNLKKIAKLIEFNTTLTFYCARHSWASIAKNINIPTAVISEAMGHTSEITTKIYLASFEDSVINNANKLIINQLSL